MVIITREYKQEKFIVGETYWCMFEYRNKDFDLMKDTGQATVLKRTSKTITIKLNKNIPIYENYKLKVYEDFFGLERTKAGYFQMTASEENIVKLQDEGDKL